MKLDPGRRAQFAARFNECLNQNLARVYQQGLDPAPAGQTAQTLYADACLSFHTDNALERLLAASLVEDSLRENRFQHLETSLLNNAARARIDNLPPRLSASQGHINDIRTPARAALNSLGSTVVHREASDIRLLTAIKGRIK